MQQFAYTEDNDESAHMCASPAVRPLLTPSSPRIARTARDAFVESALNLDFGRPRLVSLRKRQHILACVSGRPLLLTSEWCIRYKARLLSRFPSEVAPIVASSLMCVPTLVVRAPTCVSACKSKRRRARASVLSALMAPDSRNCRA